MSALKTRLAWITSFALCAALFATGCDTGPAEDPAIETIDPAPPAMPGDAPGGMDRSGLMRGMPGGAVSDPTGDSYAPADEPIPVDPPADEPIPVDPPADEPIPVDPPADEPAPVDPPADEPAPVEPEPAEPGTDDPSL